MDRGWLWESEPIRYSQSDNEHPGPPSSPAQREAHCGRISTREKAQKQLNNSHERYVNDKIIDAACRYRGFHVNLCATDR